MKLMKHILCVAASRLESPDWTPIQTNTVGTNTITIVDTNAAQLPWRFYRLALP